MRNNVLLDDRAKALLGGVIEMKVRGEAVSPAASGCSRPKLIRKRGSEDSWARRAPASTSEDI